MDINDVNFEQDYQKFIKELDNWIIETKSMMSKSMIILKDIQNKYDNWDKNKNKIKIYNIFFKKYCFYPKSMTIWTSTIMAIERK